MKHKLLGRILAVLMAFSMVVPAFAADYVAAVTHAGEELDNISEDQKYTQDAFESGDYCDALEEGSGNTLHILDSISVSGTVYVGGENTIVDLHENTLTVNGATEDGAITVDGNGGATVQNGTVILGAPDDESAEAPDAVIKGGANDVNIKNINVKTEDGVDVKAAFSTGHGTVTVEDSVVDVGDAPVFGKNQNADVAPDRVKGNAVSGVFYGPMTDEDSGLNVSQGTVLSMPDDPTQDTPGGSDPGTSEPTKKPTVIYSDKTAAIVKDEDGEYHLYDDLSKAVGSSNGKPVVVLNQEAIKDLKLDEGETLILVDKEGSAIKDVSGITPPEGFEVKVENGVISVVKKDDGNQGGNQGGTNPPVIDPGIEGPGEMDGPGEVEIDDPDTPLASLPITLAPTDKLTRGMLMSILYQMDNAPAAKLAAFIDVAADSDYAEAIGWASANGIAKGVSADKFAPEDFVTRGQLVTFLNRYAAYVGSDVTVELNGNANEVITWAVAEEIINDFFARLNA